MEGAVEMRPLVDQEGARIDELVRICYKSHGWWRSRMIVKFTCRGGRTVTEIVYGSRSFVEIPDGASNIEVRFQVQRFIIAPWCDIKKYDRFKKCWCEPTEPHVFRYQTPQTRIFTVSGPLYKEAVMKITDGDDFEQDELSFVESGRIRYIAKGLWSSRMIVQYTMDRKRTREIANGSGSSVVIPDGASNVRVSFQVRFILGWDDVKKYDRDSERWWEPYEVHYFEYPTPPNRTFTLSGSLHYVAVMKVTDGHDDNDLREL